MPYCKEFLDLFKGEHFENFLAHSLFRNLNLSIADVEENLKYLDSTVICPWMDHLYKAYIGDKEALRPFHLGLGNPNSNILIVGKELGISIGKPNPPELDPSICTITNYYRELFVNEAILNYFLWACKVRGINIPPNCLIQDPEFASSFCHLYNEEKRFPQHYWGNLSKVIGSYLTRNIENYENERSFFQSRFYNTSFFNHTFLTELHDIPSAQSPADLTPGVIPSRLNFLATNPFFRKFNRIVFCCRTYLSDYAPNYKSSIEANYAVSMDYDFIPTRNITEVYISNEKRIILCSNLAGTAGWSPEELIQLGDFLK